MTADKKGLFTDRDPNNKFGYGVIDTNALANALTNPATVTLTATT
jgi:hypothetical protein